MNFRRSKSAIFIFTAVVGGFFLSPKSLAFVGAVSAGTGEAGRAAVEASESPFGNPASLAFITGYYFTAGYGSARKTIAGDNQDLAISLTDNMRETVVPTALSYVQNNSQLSQGQDDLRRQIKLSMGNFITEGVSFGLGVTHTDDRLPYDQYAQTNVQTGFLWSPNKDVGFAAVFDNMLKPNESLPKELQVDQTMGFGASYNYKKFVRFKTDLISNRNNKFDKPTLAAGMESYMNKWLILRWGVQRNYELESDLYSGGMGFIGPRFGLHYAYQTSPQDEHLARHSVDLAVPIW